MTLTRIFQMAAPLGSRAALGGLLLALGGVSIADAQYYPPGAGGQYQAPPGYRRPPPPPDYYRPPPRPRPDYYRPAPPPDYYGYSRRRAFGSVCVTSRGSCSIGRAVPLPAGCVCNIPGFGRKRGAVQ